MKERGPDYLIRSGGGDLFASADIDPEVFEAFVELIRQGLSKGAYQMEPNELPYAGPAKRVADAVLLHGCPKCGKQ